MLYPFSAAGLLHHITGLDLWSQNLFIAKYFYIMYEPVWSGSEAQVYVVNVDGRKVIFVPTPLGGITYPEEDTERIIAQLRTMGDGELGSFYYEPYIEFGYVNLETDEGGYPAYAYGVGSPLHRLVDAFAEEGFTFRDVTSLRD